jgi:hypothetical protein
MDAGVQQCGERGGDGGAGARSAAGQAHEPHRHGRACDLGRQQRPEATGVRSHDHVLLADEFRVGHPDVLVVPDARRQPVDRAAAGQHAVDDPPSGGDALHGGVGELDRRPPGDVEQVR